MNYPDTGWEGIAADARYLYLGDFGNNYGTGRGRRLLRVPLAGLGPGADTVPAQAIHFYYPDQTAFGGGLDNHDDCDCEAVFFRNDSLHLFTKDWANHRTRRYTVPAAPGTHAARLNATFDANGLITAADLSPDGTAAALLGYDATTGATFVWLLSVFPGTQFSGAASGASRGPARRGWAQSRACALRGPAGC